jgi:hypothetical protein
MKVQWCWRCKMDVPMLDEEEFERVSSVFMESAKRFLANEAAQRRGDSGPAVLVPTCAEYERLTGFRETNPSAVMHHRLSLYGPPCTTCGKPLRTPEARHCAACGTLR